MHPGVAAQPRRAVRAGVPTLQPEERKVDCFVYCIALNARFDPPIHGKGHLMNSIVYLVGAIVIILAVLSFFGLR